MDANLRVVAGHNCLRSEPAEGKLVSRGRQTFRQGDLTKAIKGAEKAGFKVQRAEIGADGRIILDFAQQAQQAAQEANEWDAAT
jgi:hypothetical protein